MLTSLALFLTPVLQSLIATAVFESGKAGVSFLADKKSMEKRYKNAFEKAVCRFYADPEYAGNEARRNYDHYLKALKNDFKIEEDFKPEKGQYKQLLEFFEFLKRKFVRTKDCGSGQYSECSVHRLLL